MTVKKEHYCCKTIELGLFYGSYKDGCGKIATHRDVHGNHLCHKHYNVWAKRYQKNNPKWNREKHEKNLTK